jgi:hypothetical protein
MSCEKVQKSMSGFLDRVLGEEDTVSVTEHLAQCRECEERLEAMTDLRTDVRRLPMETPPVRLTSQLRVIASHERMRRLARRSVSSVLRHWCEQLRLTTDNLMRPLALPFAGGLLSAMVIFGMLVPTLNFRHDFGHDVPTAFYTDPSLAEVSPFDFTTDDVLVEFMVNEKGQIIDYSVSQGKLTAQLQRVINDMILYSTCNPATLFGQPTSGRMIVTFRRSQIDVKG